MTTITLDEALSMGRGVERPFSCPTPEHEDANASASVNVEKGLWVCFACSAAGSLEGFSPSAEDVKKMLDREVVRERVYPEAWLDLYDADHPSPYWAERYGVEVASAYRCGTHPFTGNPTYPLRDAGGRVLGVVQRDDDPFAKAKYLYPPNTSTSKTLFGLEVPRPLWPIVVLVEGASDVMALEEERPNDVMVLGTYGAGLHAPQVDIIRSISPVLVLAGFDADSAGEKAAVRARSQLHGYVVRRVFWDRAGATDAGSIPEPERRWQCVAAAYPATTKEKK